MTSSTDLSDYFTKYHKIENHLYLGDIKSALNSETLKAENISIVISVIDYDISEDYKIPGITYHRINLKDDPNEEIFTILPETNRIITEGQSKGQNVLVHCSAGVSRSATIVIAFLMSKHKKSYKEIRKSVEKIRKKIDPNTGFVEQLILFEEIGFTVDANNRKLRQYLIQSLLFNKSVHNSINRYYQKLTQLEQISQKPLNLGKDYFCSKCGFVLCHELNAIKRQELRADESHKSCHSVYIEAQDWMREKIFDLFDSKQKINSSKLMIHCPSCKEPVLNFNKDFKSYKCNCVQHKQLKCLYFILRKDKFKTQ